ncbi:MAG: HYR domain-containing protein, partial [Bacteroidota bacterium]
MISKKFTNIATQLCLLVMLFFCAGQLNAQTATVTATGGVPVGAANGALTASSVGIIPAGSTIDAITISMEITHTWVGDLDGTLTSPDGTVIDLFDEPGVPATLFGCNQDNLNVTFDDAATNTATDFENECNTSFTGAGNPGPPYAISGTYQPIGSLASLAGEDAVGDYTLDIIDNFPGADDGFIESITLEIAFTAPPCVFNCPSDMTINLDPGACGQVVSYDAEAIAGCLSTNQTSGLPSGSEFPIGTTTNTFVYTDAVGATQTCTFSITVNEFVPTSNDITCNSLVNISLDENCQAVVGADQILEGNNYGCYDDFQVLFDDGPLEGQPVLLGPGNVGQTYDVRVVNPSGNVCWGTILVEDKIPPVLVCYDLELECDEPLPTEPAPATTANGIVPTLTDGGNGGAVGGTVYFTLTNNTLFDIDIAAQMNITQATLVDVYLTAGGHAGNEGNAAVWTLIGQLDATTGPFSGPFPGDGTLTDALGGVPVPPGTWGIALHTLTAAHNYTNGNGANQNYSDGTVDLELGSASNGLFGGGIFTPRVFNGAVTYVQNVPQVSPFDSCGPVTVTFEDSVQEFDCSPTSNVLEIITRTWTVADGSGNETSCTVTYTRIAKELDEITIPADITIDCECDEDDIFQNTNPSDPCTFTTNASLVGQLVTGEPVGDGCNIDVTKDDLIIPICSGSYKVVRTWTLVDWCNNETREEIQIIKVEDSTGPNLVCPADLTIGTTSNACSGNVILPAVFPTDNCSNVDLPVVLTASAGSLTYNSFTEEWTLVGLPLGTSTVTYTATDDCGNESTCTQEITVVDNIAPIAICDEFTVVGLGSDGEALIEAITFDDGSTDNCGIVSIDARRMDNPNCPGFDGTPFGPVVPFKCCDKGTPIMVEFRVTDAAGNSNTCMVEVEVQDKLDPVIVCP